ncbi:hypothetical protein Cylst_5061 [Cylindrospermum stagnale PCC 7417]|uniref:Uncharacterized protein n=1 Tax=Cylindrospermum stagnale PCC 7417 TaxID=56107 RepID=K9X660_9NOST|nr:hypothetical protein Cylst_5061 [Cylindrospermum stagnale PCC 7417]
MADKYILGRQTAPPTTIDELEAIGYRFNFRASAADIPSP